MRTAFFRAIALPLLAASVLFACAGETGGGGGAGGKPGATTSGAGGVECVTANDCRLEADECRRRACTAGRCGIEDEPQGTPTTYQVAGDCKRSVCDGKGNTVLVDDDADVPGDHAECIVGTCAHGMPDTTASAAGTACTMNSGNVCDGAGACVECLEAAQCMGGPCVDNHCIPSQCMDGMKDGDETGVDCGGGTCPRCADGQTCAAASDCTSGLCGAAGTCVEPVGGPCAGNADCGSGLCSAGLCSAVVLISMLRTHGPNIVDQYQGYGDDFIELYNPGEAAVTLDATWQVLHRSAQGLCQGSGYGGPRFVGAGQVLPPHAHFLIAGYGYLQAPPEDVAMLNSNMAMSIADAGSVTVVHNGQIVDTICFYYDPGTLAALGGTGGGCVGAPAPYPCAGTPVSNLPHDGSSTSMSAVDEGLERKPGGALGNAQNTGDSNADFVHVTPATPRDLMSPPAP
jgi:hypothetical protein